jgi:hypothetical protein
MKYLSFTAMLLVVIAAITGVLTLAGCEGSTCKSGVVYDAVTKRPLDNVYCAVVDGEVQMTDSTGRFSVCGAMASCVPHCPDITVIISRAGYNTLELDQTGSDSVKLTKQRTR